MSRVRVILLQGDVFSLRSVVGNDDAFTLRDIEGYLDHIIKTRDVSPDHLRAEMWDVDSETEPVMTVRRF